MKIILTMAISANGIIATKDGSEDFLSQDNWVRFVNLAKNVGCFVWGRKTYESVTQWKGNYLKDLEGMEKVVLSSSTLNLQEGFEQASSPEQAIKIFESKGFKEMLITGGSTVNSHFAKAGLIDEIILDVNPSIIGEGIPVFYPQDFELKLELLSFEKVGKEIVELKYKVSK